MSFEDCIDVVQEWADARFLQPPIFVDRGDPANWDFDQTDLTLDGAWHDLDLSGIVPEGASAVLFVIIVRHNAVQPNIQFRKNGNVNLINNSRIYQQVATLNNAADMIVPIGSDRIIEYISSAVAWVAINIAVKGWWL